MLRRLLGNRAARFRRSDNSCYLQPRSDFERHHTLIGSHNRRVQEQQEDELSQLLHAVCYESSDAKAQAALELAKMASERLRQSQQSSWGLTPPESSQSVAQPEVDAESVFIEVSLHGASCSRRILFVASLLSLECSLAVSDAGARARPAAGPEQVLPSCIS